MTANIWQPNALLQVNAANTVKRQVFFAVLDQQLFTLANFNYAVGTESLLVFKNGELLSPGTEYVEVNASQFFLNTKCSQGDNIIAVGFTGVTAVVDVRDTDIYIANYNALRTYVGTEETVYVQGWVSPGDAGADFFQKVFGAPGTYVDNDSSVLVPAGGDGSVGWIRRKERSLYYDNLGAAAGDLLLVPGDVVRPSDRGGVWDVVSSGSVAAPNNFELVAGPPGLTFVLRIHQYNNIKELGALPLLDSKAPLQRAIDLSVINKCAALIPEGTWHISPGVNLKTGVTLCGVGEGSMLKLLDGSITDNVIKAETKSDITLKDFSIDGSRGTQVNTQYNIYFGDCADCTVSNVSSFNSKGVGIHCYDSERMLVKNNKAFGNVFHGCEMEQCRDSFVVNNRFRNNDVHGIFVFEGEVGAAGSQNVVIQGNNLTGNSNYGIAVQGPLTKSVVVDSNVIHGNLQYGATFFNAGNDTSVFGQAGAFSRFTNNLVVKNGFHGLYVFLTKHLSITGNVFINNSLAANGGYSNILLDGLTTFTTIKDNIFTADAASNRVAYHIKENSANDGPTFVEGNDVFLPALTAKIALLHSTSHLGDNIGVKRSNRGFISVSHPAPGPVSVIVTHGLITDPEVILITPFSFDIRAADYWIERTATTFSVHFTSSIIAGTDNIQFSWEAHTPDTF